MRLSFYINKVVFVLVVTFVTLALNRGTLWLTTLDIGHSWQTLIQVLYLTELVLGACLFLTFGLIVPWVVANKGSQPDEEDPYARRYSAVIVVLALAVGGLTVGTLLGTSIGQLQEMFTAQPTSAVIATQVVYAALLFRLLHQMGLAFIQDARLYLLSRHGVQE